MAYFNILIIFVERFTHSEEVFEVIFIKQPIEPPMIGIVPILRIYLPPSSRVVKGSQKKEPQYDTTKRIRFRFF